MTNQNRKTGRLYGLGVGPGDPELVTVKAFRILQEVAVIAYPEKSRGADSYALGIAEVYFDREKKQMLPLVFPMTRDPALLAEKWNVAIESIWQHLSAGNDVAFVTEGDPLLYSTFIHLMRLMREKHPQVEILAVPGISSINGAAAALGLGLADGDEQIVIVPATDDRAAMKKALEEHDAVVFLKVAKVLPLMVSLLAELGLTEKASVVSRVTSSDQMIFHNVNEIGEDKLNYLSLMVVRK